MGYPLGDVSGAGAGSRGLAYRGEESVDILRARAARAQVRGEAGVALRRVGALGDQVDIDVEQPHRRGTADITRVGLQKAVQFRLTVHDRLDVAFHAGIADSAGLAHSEIRG